MLQLPIGRWAKRLRSRVARTVGPQQAQIGRRVCEGLEDRTLLAAPALVKDLATDGAERFTPPEPEFTVSGSRAFFVISSSLGGGRLMVTDGTAEGTRELRQFDIGVPTELTDLNGTLFFSAFDENGGQELWKSDGTTDGTVVVKDINPGIAGSSPGALYAWNGRVYFRATTVSSGHEVWSSDGTAAGTALYKDITPGLESSYPDDFTSSGGVLYFTASTPASSDELWRTDGTLAGTWQVKDIARANYGSQISKLIDVNGLLYFEAIDFGFEFGGGFGLWRSDGTEAGTFRLSYNRPNQMTAADGRLYYSAGTQLWTSDGTVAGTQSVKTFGTTSTAGPRSIRSINGQVLVHANGDRVFPSPAPNQIWRTDGTVAGTVVVDLNLPTGYQLFSIATDYGSKVVFRAKSTGIDSSFWTYDLESQATALLSDVGQDQTSYRAPFVLNGALYFMTVEGDGSSTLWKSNGTMAGTSLVTQFNDQTADSNPRELIDVNGTLYFAAVIQGGSTGLYKSDGTAAGTVNLWDWRVHGGHTLPVSLTAFNNELYFVAGSTSHASEIWKTDGTVAGTVRVTSIWPGHYGARPRYLTVSGGSLYFWADDGTLGQKLWKVDGTTGAAVMLRNFGTPSYEQDPLMTDVNGTLFFTASTPETGYELWKSDGTAAGTVLVRDIQVGTWGSGIKRMVNVGGTLFLMVSVDLETTQLWKSNGTTGGTVVVRSFRDASYYYWPMYEMIAFNGNAYFAAYDTNSGVELWRSDGTFGGTRIVKNIAGDTLPSVPTDFLVANGSLFFRASDGERALWKTDGTAAGTIRLKSVDGSDSYAYTPLTSFDGRIYFIDDDDVHGAELWMTDGTPQGTRFAANIEREGNSRPHELVVSGNRLFFAASTRIAGTELFSLEKNLPPTAIVLHQALVQENAVAGSTAGTLATIDGNLSETWIYSFVAGAGGGDNSLFAIKGDRIVTKAPFDFESRSTYSVRLRVIDAGGASTEQALTITVADVDEFDVGPITDNNAVPNSVLERSAVGTPVGITAFASDADGTNSGITYMLWDTRGGRFAIDAVTGVVTVANSELLDHAANPVWAIRILAISQDGSFSFKDDTITVARNNVFNVSPVTDTNPVANSVVENASNGTTVGITAYAFDADSFNNVVSYSLTNTAGGRFAINPTTGIVTVANASLLNYETSASHAITVRATSQDGSFSDQLFTINLTDVDEFDVGEITDSNPAPNSVPEHSAVGTPVGITAFASDADGANSAITYSLWDTRGGRFAIDAVTGVVTVANSALLDRATDPLWAIRVLAVSQDGAYSFKDFTIAVASNNAFSVSSVSDTGPAANVVSESAVNGTTVGITAYAFDADSFNNTVTYSLTNTAGGRFAINATTGVVTVANASLLNHETAALHVIVIRATSSDGSFSDQPFTINVSDVDEFDVGAITDTNAAANSVSERSAPGTPVGITASAIDADGTNSGITYSLWDTRGGRFAINSVTGVVTVANPALLNRTADPLWSIRVLAVSQDGSFSFRDFTIAITQ